MASYREQLLKESYGKDYRRIYPEKEEEAPVFLKFRLKFFLCLILFGGFAYLSMTGGSVAGVDAETIVQAVETDDFPEELPQFPQL